MQATYIGDLHIVFDRTFEILFCFSCPNLPELKESRLARLTVQLKRVSANSTVLAVTLPFSTSGKLVPEQLYIVSVNCTVSVDTLPPSTSGKLVSVHIYLQLKRAPVNSTVSVDTLPFSTSGKLILSSKFRGSTSMLMSIL